MIVYDYFLLLVFMNKRVPPENVELNPFYT